MDMISMKAKILLGTSHKLFCSLILIKYLTMFKYNSFLFLALLACASEAFQAPKPAAKAVASLDASYIERVLEWPDMLEVSPSPSRYSEQRVATTTMSKNEQAMIAAQSATYAPQLDLSKVSNLQTPAEAFESLVQKGEYNAAASNVKTIFSSVLGGCYVGMGAMVSLAVAGNAPGLAEADPGLQKMLFGALFPVNLLLALQCGGQLFTGNTANMMAAVCEGRANLSDMARSLSLSWIGNFVGCATFAVACKYAGVLEGGAGHLAETMLITKTSYELGPLLVKAMFCNWLVCLAVFLSMQAKDMTGKYLSIWLPVSTFVSIGFEHSVANMFLLPAGLMSTSDITIETALVHNLIPVTIGNAISGSLLVGAAMSFMYGKLGEDQ